MAVLKVHILQDRDGKILAVETSLKKLITIHGEKYHFLSYQHTNRLCKKAKEQGLSFIEFKNKENLGLVLSWWDI